MVVRVWHLGVLVLLVLLMLGYYVTQGSSGAGGGQAQATATVGANIRTLEPSIASYNTDNVPDGKNDPNADKKDSGYTGMTIAILRSKYDQAISTTEDWVNPTDPGFPAGVVKVTPSKTTYCAVSMVDSVYAWQLGHDGVIKTSTTPSAVCAS
jgi:hypothetical protein